jgi:hypothetical protein
VLAALGGFASRQRELRAREGPRNPPTARDKALDVLRLGAMRRRRVKRARRSA